jgi:hypothetical protein
MILTVQRAAPAPTGNDMPFGSQEYVKKPSTTGKIDAALFLSNGEIRLRPDTG